MQTIPDYANHTLDELKAVVYQHMLEQGTYAHANRNCWYLISGNKCAVGLFIPDNLYHPDMEREATLMEIMEGMGERRQPKLWEALKKLGLESPEKLDFLLEMQALHDEHAGNGEPFDKYLEALEMYQTSPD